MVQFRVIAAVLALACASCASMPPIRVPVEVEKVVYVRVDPALTSPCTIAMPRNASGKEVLRVARERRQALETCNSKLKRIAEIEGTTRP